MLSSIAESNKLSLNNKYIPSHDENQYLWLINDILRKGTMEAGRNGNVLSVFGAAMHFKLYNNILPLLTTKKLAWKTCLKELLWFIRGQTDNELLRSQNVHIWDGNGSREFLDSRGLHHLKEHDLGPVYGHQWRHFNAEYTDCHTDYEGKGVDQLANIINALKDPSQRNSRRLVMSAWNPCQNDKMALPPCHVLCQFYVEGNFLSCSIYMRSNDIMLGCPFNIASYSFLTHLLAHHCGLEPGELMYFIGNAHIYESHIGGAKEQMFRDPYEFPKLKIKNKYENINDYTVDDFEVIKYAYEPAIKMDMVA